MRHNNLYLRIKTPVAEKGADKLTDKLVPYIIYVLRVHQKQKFELAQIVAMDKTPFQSDIVSATTINTAGNQ